MAGYWPSSFFACLWTETKFARSGSQSQREIWFILPAHGARHIIICDIFFSISWVSMVAIKRTDNFFLITDKICTGRISEKY